MSTTRLIFFVRHGETEWNALRKLNSYTNIPLSKVGRLQVERLSDSFCPVHLDYIFSSPLVRAKETATILARKSDKKILFDNNLTEASFGSFEGESAQVMENPKFAGVFQRWRDGEYVDPRYKLEPLIEVANRAASFLQKIKPLEGNILVAAHGYLIRVLLAVHVMRI